MPNTESRRNGKSSLDNVSFQAHNDNRKSKGMGRNTLSSWTKKLTGRDQHNHHDEQEDPQHSYEGLANRTLRHTDSLQVPNDQRPAPPGKDGDATNGDGIMTGDSRTPIADSQIARRDLANVIEPSTTNMPIDQDNLPARYIILQSQVEKHREESHRANLECSQLQEEVSRLRTERDKSHKQHTDLHTMYAALDLDAEQLRKDRDKLHNDKTKLQADITILQTGNETLAKQYQQLENDMEKKAKDIRQAKNTLDEEKERWHRYNEVVLDLKGQLESLRTKFSDQGVVLAIVKKERNSLKHLAASYDKLRDQQKTTLEDLDRCNAKLLDCQQNYDDIKVKHSIASDDLKRLTLESRSTLGDDFLIHNFQGLQGAIRQWANEYFRGEEKKMWKTHRPHEHPVIHTQLLELTSDAKDLLMFSETGSGRSVMCEAYLWRYIEEQIFDSKPAEYSKGMFWAHDVRSDLCRLERFLRPGKRWSDAEKRMFYKWKASTAKLIISRLRPPNDRSRIAIDPKTHSWLVDRALDVLRPWMTSDNEHACIEDLEAIIQLAIDFDSHMNEQWSFMYVGTKPLGFESRHGFPFDGEMMEPIRNEMQIFAGDPVGIIVSPALVRMGTANADNYHLQTILVRSKVIPQGFSARSQRSKISKTAGLVTQSLQRR
ncbi:hypothetical protein BKA65DRAFT_494415 [Rhexocercosporidium sp. MPI-PUGE-AT-0058]|nr:hypothetical protein BKA65DRAFT_494415 [Rhexocercosporidium sp. MPI-PUGE-AT-0058]